MCGDRARHFLASLLIALAVALLATLGGNWGSALGQTAGPPPTRPPVNSGITIDPIVTPPPTTDYRPASSVGGSPAPPGATKQLLSGTAPPESSSAVSPVADYDFALQVVTVLLGSAALAIGIAGIRWLRRPAG